MIVDISSITIKLSALELEVFLIHSHLSLKNSALSLDANEIKNYNELCEVCNRTYLII